MFWFLRFSLTDEPWQQATDSAHSTCVSRIYPMSYSTTNITSEIPPHSDEHTRKWDAMQMKPTKVTPGSESALALRGFDIFFVWHIILIFSPIALSHADNIWMRQLVIGCALGIAFLGSASVFEKLYLAATQAQKGARAAVTFVALLGAVATAASMLFSDLIPALASTAVAGACEALLMTLWLANYTYSPASVGIENGTALRSAIGTAAAFFVCNLNYPLAVVTTSLLPLVSTHMLFRTLDKVDKDSFLESVRKLDNEPIGPIAKVMSVTTRAWYNNLMLLSVIVFGMLFGLQQLVYAKAGGTLLGATDPVVILGATLAYVFIHYTFTHDSNPTKFLVNIALSFIVFSIGAFGMWASFSHPAAWTAFGFLYMMGFHLFDFTVLSLISRIVRPRFNPIFRICINRAGLYISYGISFLLGNALYSALSGGQALVIAAITCASIVVLMATLSVIFMFQLTNPWHEESRGADNETADSTAPESLEEQPESVHNAIVSKYGLSPREEEVFFYLTEGRNASYIGQALWISPNTAKNHIANIYKKTGAHSVQDIQSLVEESTKSIGK